MCYAPELRVPDALMLWRAHWVKDDMTLQGCLEANVSARCMSVSKWDCCIDRRKGLDRDAGFADS